MSQEPLTKCVQVSKDSNLHPIIKDTIKKIHAHNIKKLIERGISG
jgi:hypothetical protein